MSNIKIKDIKDEDLIQNYLQGDERSFEILVKRYLKPIYRFIYQYVSNSQNAEDLTQEVFLKVWRFIKKFDFDRKFKTWIFTIAKNTTLDFLKKKKDLPFSVFSNEKGQTIIDEKIFDSDFDFEKIIERRDLAQRLNLIIKKIPLIYREILFLYYFDGFNFREIAEILNQPLNTIKSRHRRAIIILKKLLSAII